MTEMIVIFDRDTSPDRDSTLQFLKSFELTHKIVSQYLIPMYYVYCTYNS